jgi:hypothetical protein
MRSLPRKTTPKVKDGKVQRKNHSAPTPSYWNTPQDYPVIDRQPPGKGYRHVLMKRDVQRFIDILPDWKELSKALNAIVLAPGSSNCMGWHRPGIVAVCAWSRDLVEDWHDDFVSRHLDVLDRLGVERERTDDDVQLCHFTDASARGFQLMHIFLHELGHHHDRMTTRAQRRASRGEGFAEEYALRHADRLWDQYFKVFGW